MACPDRAQELQLAGRTLGPDAPESILDRGAVAPVIDAQALADLRAALAALTVREELVAYVVDLVRATRAHDSVLVGAGPRATQALILGARAAAAVAGRDFVTPDDVKRMAQPVLAHRLILRPEYEVEGLSVGEVIDRILSEIAVPR
jgi:MoxR-like ATPase